MTNRGQALEKLFWSIALPGFGQLLNKKYLKGLLLIVLEFLINMNANLNLVIIDSFYGDTEKAVLETDCQWLMFYPCVYLYAIWDAYRDAGGGLAPYSFVPFVLAAYLSTVGLIYSKTLTIMGILPGPVFLPILSIGLGFAAGLLIQRVLLQTRRE